MQETASGGRLVGLRRQLAAHHPSSLSTRPYTTHRSLRISRRPYDLSRLGARLEGHWTDLEELRLGQDGSTATHFRKPLVQATLPLARGASLLSR